MIFFMTRITNALPHYIELRKKCLEKFNSPASAELHVPRIMISCQNNKGTQHLRITNVFICPIELWEKKTLSDSPRRRKAVTAIRVTSCSRFVSPFTDLQLTIYLHFAFLHPFQKRESMKRFYVCYRIED